MKCAVVGSGPSLLNNYHGEFIDSHDVIIRCNRAITNSYESHVGSRTDIRFLNIHCMISLLNFEQNLNHLKYEFEAWEEIKISDVISENEIIYLKDYISFSFKSDKNEFKEVPAEVFDYGSELQNLTSGFCAVVFASLNYEKVNCFGFDFFKENNYNHYYENVKKTGYCHEVEKEKMLLHKLSNVNFIQG